MAVVTGHALTRLVVRPSADRTQGVIPTSRIRGGRKRERVNRVMEVMFNRKNRIVLNIVKFPDNPSLSYFKYIQLQFSISVCCSPPIVRVQQRLVVSLVDVVSASSNKWNT